MPSIGRFLDMLEAISRKDWGAIEVVLRQVAKEERKKKHYQAAHQIEQALDIVMSTAQLSDTIGTVASPITPSIPNPPDLLHEIDSTNVRKPFFNSKTESVIVEFIGEWNKEHDLLNKGIEPRKTVLLYGPPGCGKTHLASYIAKQLKMRLFLVRFDSLISSYLGETASNLRKIFQFLTSNRCVLLLDELDAIGKLRDDKNELGELKRVVISLLQNIDLNNNHSILISATNHPHMLDPAIWRRFEFVLEIDMPSESERLSIIEANIPSKIFPEIRNALLSVTEGFTGSDLTQICKNARRKSLLQNSSDIVPYLFISILDNLNILRDPPKKNDERKIMAALVLKKNYPKQYSYNTLETLSGIPHSTLHSKASKELD